MAPLSGTAILDPTLGLGADTSGLYVANWAGTTGGAFRVSKQDGGTTLLDGCNTAAAIASDANDVFWVTASCAQSTGLVRGGSKTGPFNTSSASFELAPGPVRATGMIAMDATRVFWAVHSQLLSLPKDLKGTSSLIATSVGDIHAIAIDDRAYYLAGNGLFAADKIGGLPTTVSTEVASNAVGGLAAKDGLVYATDAAHARIIRVRGDGAGLQAIATGHSQPTALAVDDCFAYWSDLADGTIWRVDR